LVGHIDVSGSAGNLINMNKNELFEMAGKWRLATWNSPSRSSQYNFETIILEDIMQTLFIKVDKNFEEVGKTIFTELGFRSVQEKETSFNSKGFYFSVNVLGLSIKLDVNNYDYEDMYNYIIGIKMAIGTKLYDENSLYSVAEIMASIIAKKIGLDVALEYELRNPSSKTYSLKVFSFDGEKIIIQDKVFNN